MTSNKVSQGVPSVSTTRQAPAVGRVLRNRTQSDNKDTSITNEAKDKATSSRAAGGSRQAQSSEDSNTNTSSGLNQTEEKGSKRRVRRIGPPTEPENAAPAPLVVAKATKVTKVTKHKAIVPPKKAPSGSYKRVPWKPEELDKLRLLMDGVEGYPSVQDRKNWASALKKHQNSLDTRVKAEWERKERSEFTVPLNDTLPAIPQQPSRHQSVVTNLSRRTSATDLTAGTSVAASSLASTSTATRARSEGPQAIKPSKVSSSRFRYAKVAIGQLPESNIRASGENGVNERSEGSSNSGRQTITGSLAAFIQSGIREIEEKHGF